MVLFSAAAGICLWGLFNLLDNLKQPELLRSSRVIVVKGCEPQEAPQAVQRCPQLYCEKALLESHAVPLRAHFNVTIDRTDANAAHAIHLIAGTVNTAGQAGDDGGFACLLDGSKVIASRRLTATELAALAKQPGNWQL